MNEMASQLVRAGESVELLALLDAARPQAPMKPSLTTHRLGRLKQAVTDAKAGGRGHLECAVLGVRTIAHKVFSASRWELLNGWKRWSVWSVRARFRLLRELLSHDLTWPKFLPELSTLDIYNSAEARYLPKPLSLPSIVLVRAQRGTGNDTTCRHIYADETFGWAAIANRLTVVDVQGGHSSMFQDRFVDSLAEALLPYLQPKATLIPAQSKLRVDTEQSCVAITRPTSSAA
jgi:thioesterase domain-containing protein